MEKRIKEARKAKGLTLKQLGTLLGISESAVSNIERGRNKPSGSTLMLLCDNLGVNREWLETGKGDMFQPQPQDDQALVDQLVRAYHGSPILRAILTTYLQLDEPRRHLVEEILEGFAAAVAKARAEGEPEPDVGEYLTTHVVNTNPDEKAQ